MVLRRSTFEPLLKYLQANCETIADFDRPASGGTQSGRPRMAITFDDGWKDTATIAWPLAQKYGCSMLVFICPGLVGKPSPFWPERVSAAVHTAWRRPQLKAELGRLSGELKVDASVMTAGSASQASEAVIAGLKRLSQGEREALVAKLAALAQESPEFSESCEVDATAGWEETREMARQGVQIGSHTQTHQILPTVPRDVAAQELSASKIDIEEEIHGRCRTFAYPNGSWSGDARTLVAEAGYSYAFINTPGAWTAKTDRLLVPRTNIWEGTVCGPSGKFSPAAFEYATFWRAFRA
jgi:peptidoglycan/xylan/chitin deacetylase (PgdA/CDA1 family)